MADYRAKLIEAIVPEIERYTRLETRVVESDRLPSYSKSTLDIECFWNDQWKEVASCSLRTDYSPGITVCEIAIGLDRIVEMST